MSSGDPELARYINLKLAALGQPTNRLVGITVFDGAGDRLLHEVGGAVFMLQIMFDADAAGKRRSGGEISQDR